jgi:aspartyl-tRNA(Asn)/glutamyl-tRNA(Gln) amidotransferase subunit C
MISLEQVKHLADLAHMEFKEDELAKLQKEMDLILEYISELQEVDVSGVESVSGGHALVNVVRQGDLEQDGFAFDKELLLQFPEKQGNYDVVPKIIDK